MALEAQAQASPRRTGFRVIIGVSGHNVQGQIDMINSALQPVVEDSRRNVKLASEAIGKKAREFLASLPEDEQSVNLEAKSPEHWWLV